MIGDPDLLADRAEALQQEFSPAEYTPQSPARAGLSLLPIRLRAPVRAGRLDSANAAYVLESLDRAIQALGPEHREVFVLAQVESLKYQQISTILKIPVGTVKSRMHAAVRQIREALSREGIEP